MQFNRLGSELVPGYKAAVAVPRAGVALVIPHILNFAKPRDVESMSPVQPCIRHAVVVGYSVGMDEVVGLDVVSAFAGAPCGSHAEVQQILGSQLNIELISSGTELNKSIRMNK